MSKQTVFYFLFGEGPVDQYHESADVSEITSKDGEVFKFDEDIMTPIDLLYQYAGWEGYAEITEQEFNKLLIHFHDGSDN